MTPAVWGHPAMRVAVFAPYARWSPHLETDLEIVQQHLDQQDQVTLLSCDGEMRTCDVNPSHAAKPCRQCIGRRLGGMKLLSRPIEIESFYRLSEASARSI